MLAGFPPFNDPNPREDQLCEIIVVHGRLNDLVRAWNLTLSKEVRANNAFVCQIPSLPIILI